MTARRQHAVVKIEKLPVAISPLFARSARDDGLADAGWFAQAEPDLLRRHSRKRLAALDRGPNAVRPIVRELGVIVRQDLGRYSDVLLRQPIRFGHGDVEITFP